VGNGNADRVECRSDYQYAQRPVALHWDEQRMEISAIQAEWRTPEGHSFRVITCDGRQFELFYGELDDEWRINPV
jgi:hypothetical protein